MIVCHLSTYMGKRKVRAADVAKAIGVHRNTIGLLYHETAKVIDLEVLDKLCEYFNCQVGDLFEFVKDKEPDA